MKINQKEIAMRAKRQNRINYRPQNIPHVLNQKEQTLYIRFYNSVETDLRAVGKKSK